MNNLTVDTIIDGMIKITSNAQSLVDEGELLFKNGYYSRAYTLSHIAREEMSKLFMLFKVGIEIIGGKEYDYKKLQKRLRDHKSKIQFFTLPVTLDGLNGGYIKGINKRKNDSLYVGYEKELFMLPSEHITEHIARRTLDIATSNIIKMINVYEIIQSLEHWKNAPKEDFDKTFGHIIYKTNEELIQEINYEKSMKLFNFVNEKLVERCNTNILKKEKNDYNT